MALPALRAGPAPPENSAALSERAGRGGGDPCVPVHDQVRLLGRRVCVPAP